MDLSAPDQGRPAIGGCTLSLELLCDCRPDERPCRIEQFAYEPIIDGAVLLGEYMVVAGESGAVRQCDRSGVAELSCSHCRRSPRISRVRMRRLLRYLVRQEGTGRHVQRSLAWLERAVL